MLELSLAAIDRSARSGMKYASSLLLIAEVLMRSFHEPDTAGVSRKDTGAIISLLGPVSRLVFDQCCRVAVKSTTERRSLALDSLSWPSPAVKESFRTLPILGEDIFGGKFEEHLQAEASKLKALKEAELCMSKPPPRHSWPSRSSKKSSKNPDQQSGRPTRPKSPRRKRNDYDRGSRRGGRGSRSSKRSYRP